MTKRPRRITSYNVCYTKLLRNGLGISEENIVQQLSGDTDETTRRLIIEVDEVPFGEMNYRNKGNGIAEIGIKICDFSKQEKGHGKKLLSMSYNFV